MIKYKIKEYCIICEKKYKRIIDLRKFPVTEFLINKNQHNNTNYLIDQGLLYCEDCNHLSIEKVLDPNFIYSNYMMRSTTSGGAMHCLKNFYQFYLKNGRANSSANIIDIGGNDSSFLYLFPKKIKKTNIDINASTIREDIKIQKFFFEKIDFQKFAAKKKNIFFCSHTIEHLEYPEILIQNLSKNIKKKDILYLQFPCFELMHLNQRYDELCHQHINLFSLKSINKLLKKFNLKILDFEYDDTHFGTLRLKVAKKASNKKIIYKNIKLQKVIENFQKFKNYYINLVNFYNNTYNIKQGYGAGILVPILNYFLPCINKFEYIFDENSDKFNKKFITMKPVITSPQKINLNEPIMITSISSRMATRSILEKLNKMGAKKIIIPSLMV